METIQALMDELNRTFSFVNSNWFYLLFTLSAMINPIGVFLQAYRAWTAPSTEGLSFSFFFMMIYLQGITTFYGIMVKEPAITLVMLLSFLGTGATLTALVVRKSLR